MELAAEEMISFGLQTLADFDALIEKNSEALENLYSEKTYVGFVRDVLLLENAERYFLDCWNNNWQIMNESSFSFHKKYNKCKTFEKLLDEQGIRVEPERE